MTARNIMINKLDYNEVYANGVIGLWTITAKDKSRFSFRDKIDSRD